MRTCAGATSSSSAAICVSAVRMPWPISTLPVATRTRPGSSKPTHCDSSGLSIRLCGSVLAIMPIALIVAPARSTARMTRLCMPQRHRCGSSAATISARLGRRIAREQRRRRDQDAREAIAALAGLLVEEGLLQRMQRAVAASPSTVVTALPATVATSRAHEYDGSPSISTMQAPHCSVPQPNRLPRRRKLFAQHRQQRRRAIAIDMNGRAVDDEVVSSARFIPA